MEQNFTICETIAEARHFIGGRSPIEHLGKHALLRLKDEAVTNKYILHSATVDCDVAGNRKQRMQLNGALAARGSIINRIDQLLKAKGLGGSATTGA